jgi:broad specificity phosphatase PhoE
VILVRHSVPEIEAARPACQWGLSKEGRARCLSLADDLRPHHPELILSSTEPKAQETAALLAKALHLAWHTAENLHEHERASVPFFESRAAFHEAIQAFFRHPHARVFGDETAIQALNRFANALRHALSLYPEKTVVIISHGTVMSLFIAHLTGDDPCAVWQKLKFPDFVVIPPSSR